MANTGALSGEDLPPYQLQCLLDTVGSEFTVSAQSAQVLCAQASGPEIYVGCSNGDLLRFALHPNANTRSMEAYTLLSRQSVPNGKPVDDMVLIPSLSRVLVLSDRQVLVYTLPALDMIPSTVYKPIRNVFSLAVDEQQLRPTHRALSVPQHASAVGFCVIKRQSVSIYHLREKPLYEKDIPLPARIHLARRSGRYLCVADHENYNMIDLETASLFPLLPISQAPSEAPVSEAPQAPVVKPFILVVAESEFLILSWTGASTLGLFLTGEGDPVRGTLEWSSHPISVAFDEPYVTTLLPDGTVEIHNIDTQALVQSIPAPTSTPTPSIPIPTDRKSIVVCSAGFFVPSSERESKLRPTAVKLGRPKPQSDVELLPKQDAAATAGMPDHDGDIDDFESGIGGDQDVEVIDAV